MITFYDKYGQPMDGTDDWIELQWNRRYYSAGDWVLYMPARIYNPDWKYIQIQDRPEWGMVQKWQFEKKSEGDFMTLSGFFLEKSLDWGMTSLYGAPQIPQNAGTTRLMVSTRLTSAFHIKSSQVEDLYKTSTALSECRSVVGSESFPYGYSMGFDAGNKAGEGFMERFQYGGWQLRCVPEFQDDDQYSYLGIRFEGYQGQDRRDSVFFGSAWNNVKQINYTLDESGAYSDIIVVQKLNGATTPRPYPDAVVWSENFYQPVIPALIRKYHYAQNQHSGFGDASRPAYMVILSAIDPPADENEAYTEMERVAQEESLKHQILENISVDIIQNTFIYGEDYDLGDICTVSIDEIQQQFVARIVEVHEVYSKNQKNFQIVLGTPSKTNYRRIIT